LIAQGWRKRDAIRRARAELENDLANSRARNRPDPYRNHRMADTVHTDGTAPTAMWDIEQEATA